MPITCATHLDHSAFFEPETGRLLPEEAAAELIPADAADAAAQAIDRSALGFALAVQTPESVSGWGGIRSKRATMGGPSAETSSR